MSDSHLVRSVTQKGQVTIPVEIRELLDIQTGDRVVFYVEEGRVILSAVRETLRSAYGSVEPLQRPEDFDRLREEAIDDKVTRTLDDMRDRP